MRLDALMMVRVSVSFLKCILLQEVVDRAVLKFRSIVLSICVLSVCFQYQSLDELGDDCRLYLRLVVHVNATFILLSSDARGMFSLNS